MFVISYEFGGEPHDRNAQEHIRRTRVRSVVCVMTAVNDAARGAFDGSSAAMVVCACFMGGFSVAVLCYTKGGE